MGILLKSSPRTSFYSLGSALRERVAAPRSTICIWGNGLSANPYIDVLPSLGSSGRIIPHSNASRFLCIYIIALQTLWLCLPYLVDGSLNTYPMGCAWTIQVTPNSLGALIHLGGCYESPLHRQIDILSLYIFYRKMVQRQDYEIRKYLFYIRDLSLRNKGLKYIYPRVWGFMYVISITHLPGSIIAYISPDKKRFSPRYQSIFLCPGKVCLTRSPPIRQGGVITFTFLAGPERSTQPALYSGRSCVPETRFMHLSLWLVTETIYIYLYTSLYMIFSSRKASWKKQAPALARCSRGNEME